MATSSAASSSRRTAIAAPVEPAARPHYFDGKFLAARDLMNEQASSSDTGFDLV